MSGMPLLQDSHAQPFMYVKLYFRYFFRSQI